MVIIDLLGLISTCYACISKVYHRLVPTGRIFSVGWLGFYRSTGWEPSANSVDDQLIFSQELGEYDKRIRIVEINGPMFFGSV
ncbi:hypothetical protein [Sphaerochaeta sp. S2]|uniref:hypothetical protein n=1 Tax=Sphaerochaeta sp. S2 TaxID=2798868 RepID=UPI0018E98FE2|nr:hypothetical protein [Sphaerochaeta sp. S2]MBJ2355822.1 hypothetical protein [Sphaerochaeta sp. S2]